MISKELIVEILEDWNFWKKEPDTGILRESYVKKLEQFSQTDQVVVVTGVRRAGKSTILKQYISNKIKKGEERKNFLYVNLEEPKFRSELSLEFLQRIYEAYLELLDPVSKPFLFFDEVQLIPGWETFVRGLHEKNKARIFVSGSSAKLLSKEFATVLTGRHIDIKVYPLTFPEFLEFKRLIIQDKLDIVSQKQKIKQLLKEYLEYGGFPLVALKEEKKEILTNYFEDILAKDVAERHRIKKVEKLRGLAQFYLTNVSSLASFRKIKEFLGLSLDSVERFSLYLEEAYLLFLKTKFAYSLKEQEINPRKIYCIDNGLKNLVSFRFSENLGNSYENAVFFKLLVQGKEIFYWKGRQECDFLIKQGNKLTCAIQVCYDIKRENEERELLGLLETLGKFKLNEGIVITSDLEEIRKINHKKITFIPLWKWLLTN
ncbi:MAG TPA: ATP-binding protein [Candidatus Nanoarchaeia archaeon]|nr:ATP-binding protein [Candidatus Nanoarchaeia archaeon]